MKFTETNIARSLARHIFERKHLVIVPNCSWPQNECDLLAVTPNLRIIDVEIKISRADLKADAKKDKWFHHWDYFKDGPWQNDSQRKPRQWPHRVWKHYYCLPKAIWKPELFDCMNANSGLLLIDDFGNVQCHRRAKPDTKAEKLTPEDAIDIARLASLRMWDAYERMDRAIEDMRRQQQIIDPQPSQRTG